MKLTVRQLKVLDILKNQKSFKTAEFFSLELNVSKRTIYADLKKISKYLSNTNYKLIKQPGVGVKLISTILEDRTDIYPKILTDRSHSHELSISDRRIEMIILFLFQEKELTFDLLSNKYFVSKTSIKNDLLYISKILFKDNKLKFKSDQDGTKIVGNEKNWQRGFLNFNNYITQNMASRNQSNKNILDSLTEYYGKDIIQVCHRVFYSLTVKKIEILSEYYSSNMLNMIVVMIYRLSQNRFLESNASYNLKEMDDYYEISTEILKKICSRLNLRYGDGEVEYLTKFLVSNKFISRQSDIETQRFIKEFIADVSKSLRLHLTEENVLQRQLEKHIPAMLFRLKNEITVSNPFIEQIKREFSITFNIIWMSLNNFERELEVLFTEDEVGFLCLYFESAIEREKLSKRLLIICPTGIVTSELLLNKIKNIIPSHDILEVAAVHEIADINLQDYDFIISTVYLDNSLKNVIQVSPLLNDMDIKNISEMYNTQFLLKDTASQEKSKYQTLLEFLNEDHLYWNCDFKDKASLLNFIGNELIDKKYIEDEFIESIFIREDLGGTDLQTGAAVPHGNPIYCHKSIVAIVRNNQFIKWDTYNVKIIILICISEKDSEKLKPLLSEIYNLVSSKQRIHNVLLVDSKEKFIQMIGSDESEQ